MISSWRGKRIDRGANEQRWDFATSVEEVMTHLHVYVMSKQVLYLGVSDTPAWVVVKANECRP
jgi:aryl-alcohol dehydrogenase-like predicted oxidoreductase